MAWFDPMTSFGTESCDDKQMLSSTKSGGCWEHHVEALEWVSRFREEKERLEPVGTCHAFACPDLRGRDIVYPSLYILFLHKQIRQQKAQI